MFFRKKLNRVLHVKEAEERFEKDIEKTPLEKKDRLAMVLAALIVFVPAVLLVVLVFALVLYFFFFRFLYQTEKPPEAAVRRVPGAFCVLL